MYKKIINELYSLQDLNYKIFHSKLILNDNLIGVRTNELKRIAKNLAKNDYVEFFRENKHSIYEENMIHGLVLGYLKLDFDGLIPFLQDFIHYIDNWAVCDITAANLKIFGKNKDIGLVEVKKYLKDNNYWINRFGYVLLLDYYIDDKYIDEIFGLCANYKNEYYVKMAIAWLISMCYIKYRDKTIVFLNNNLLDDWTHNKAIQKIIESNRVSNVEKNILRGLKRK